MDFQNYLSDLLIQYCELTECGGYNWDYTFFQDPSYPNQYTQWKGWMRVIGLLRDYYNKNPNGKYGLVMDHRQLNHEYGIWYQLAGSYAEPLASDENPETVELMQIFFYTQIFEQSMIIFIRYLFSMEWQYQNYILII